MSYFGDEKLRELILTIDNSYKLTKTYDYFSHRDIKSERYLLEDLGRNQVLVNRLFERELDPIHSQLDFMNLNGTPFYHHTYNNLHEMTGSSFQGNFIAFGRDESSRKLHEISENGMSRTWTYNQRNLIDTMKLDFVDRLKDRSYTYSPNAYLETINEIDPDAKDLIMNFSYASDGIISNVIKNGQSTNHQRLTDEWKIGRNSYQLDHVGRVFNRRGRTHVYGPTGRIKEAKKNKTSLATYFYDEENNPLVKVYKNGEIEFYFENSTIKAGDFYQPVLLEGTGHAVGYFKNDTFNKVDVDHLGTTIRSPNGRLSVATPYGERTNRRSDEHKVLDFTLKGYDDDLLAVRMGARYYDPQAKRFLTPDTYFLENYDKIVENPVEGNLYSYASNNPVIFTDPTGDRTSNTAAEFGIEVYSTLVSRLVGKQKLKENKQEIKTLENRNKLIVETKKAFERRKVRQLSKQKVNKEAVKIIDKNINILKSELHENNVKIGKLKDKNIEIKNRLNPPSVSAPKAYREKSGQLEI